MHVLVVDDEPQIVKAVSMNLRARGYEVTTASAAAEALRLAAARLPDAVVLDLGLPDVAGLEVIRSLRTWSTIPVIVLSGRSDSADKVEALDAGADDYVTKPFGVDELMARVRAATRRAAGGQASPVARIGAYTVDVAQRQVWRTDDPNHAQAAHLTPTEWLLLERLVLSPGRLIGQTELVHGLRGGPVGKDTSYARLYLAQLRRKLEPEPTRPRWLLTEPGMGYRFQPSHEE